jgi:hypothetical protein
VGEQHPAGRSSSWGYVFNANGGVLRALSPSSYISMTGGGRVTVREDDEEGRERHDDGKPRAYTIYT